VQKGSDYILFIKVVFGGKGQWIDAAELAIGRVLDERFDGADRVSFAGLAETLKGLLLSPESFTMSARSINGN